MAPPAAESNNELANPWGCVIRSRDSDSYIGEAINRYKDSKLPAIIVIPGIGEKIGLGMNEVRESAKRAIGADILFED